MLHKLFFKTFEQEQKFKKQKAILFLLKKFKFWLQIVCSKEKSS